jgi:hypothetical protein
LIVPRLIGLFILAGNGVRRPPIGIVERARAKALLGLDTSPPAHASTQEARGRLMKAFLTTSPGWKGIGYGLLMLPVGIANFTVMVTLWSVALVGVTYPCGAGPCPLRSTTPTSSRDGAASATPPVCFVVGVLLLMAIPAVVRALVAVTAA